MRVLIACEYSGVVREAFRELGHDAYSCDLLPANDSSAFHIQGNAVETAQYDVFRYCRRNGETMGTEY